MKRLTVYEFIEKANVTHTSKYDYSQIEYVYSSKKVPIVCRKCNLNFEQTAKTHLKGAGCPNCNRYRKDTKKFIEDAIVLHGEKYIYDKVDYIGYKSKVTITCPKNEHGDFEQTPSAHLSGQGCPRCGGSVRKKPLEFIEAAKLRHKDKYTYEKVNYSNNKTPVTIGCPVHNLDFQQTPNEHLNGGVCPKCSKSRKRNSEAFILKAQEKHGDKYNYDKVRYVDRKSKVDIFCPKEAHGIFSQVAGYHLGGNGCPKCGNNLLTDVEDFITKANLKHGYSYNYDNVEYINRKIKVEIICSFHGPFWQRPSGHLNGQGCPKCKKSIGEIEVEKYLISSGVKFEEQYTFDDCVYKKKLPFDFAIFINDKLGLIEYQGEQHFQVISYGISRTPFADVQKRDQVKKEYAEIKKIPLLLISYKEFNDIDAKVTEFINDHF